MGYNDREYAPLVPLPEWLKGFADKQLKGGSPFDDIKEIFRGKNKHSEAKEAIEAKVEELRERVGLDNIEKLASGEKDLIPGGRAEGQSDEKYDEKQMQKGIKVEMEHTPDKEIAKEITKDHLEESKDFKDQNGGKYYDELLDAEKRMDKKKASLILTLISLANELEGEGNLKAAMAVDERIKILAKDKNYAGPIEEQTKKNTYFRKVLFTGKHAQLVLMSVKVGEDLGAEVHKHVDQFFRIEEGEAIFVLNGKKKHIKDGGAVLVPAGTEHNVINASKTEPLKLYTIYSPPNHPKGTIHKTKEDAERAEENKVKADLIEDLVVLANKLEGEGKFKAAILIDSRINKLADEIILEKLTRMPIMPVEMWSDLELAQVVKNPGLATNPEEKAKWEKAKAIFDTRVKEKAKRIGLRPTDVGEWGVERGWFLLTWGGYAPLGFFNSRAQAELSKEALVKDFVETGKFPDIMKYMKSFLYGRIESKVKGPREISTKYINDEVDNILNPDRNNKNRKEFAEKSLDILKTQYGSELPKGAVVKGLRPTEQESQSAIDVIHEMPDEKLDESIRKLHSGAIDAEDEFISDAANNINKKVKYEKETGKKWDPSEMADDFSLSCREKELNHAQMADDGEKNVFDKYPGIKKHIKNICESREGHIDAPALMQIIKSRPENLTDKDLGDIKEYIKEQIKESRPETRPSKDDDVIGRGGEEVDMNDDQNSEVFSMPAKI